MRIEANQHLDNYANVSNVTLLLWNIDITVTILGSLGQELDPVLDLSHTAINSMAGALAPVAHYSHLGESKIIK